VENTGTSWSFAAIQKLSLPSIGKLRQRLTVGGELKSSDQFVLFGGASFSPGEVKLLNAKINYGIARDWKDGSFWLDTSLLGSPGGLFAGNDDEDFQVYDPEAVANYGIIRSAGQVWWGIGDDWRILLRGSGQFATTRLLPIEQFAAGGYQTVRGVTEREYFADDGWQTCFELYAPAITFKEQYQMRFLVFHDQATLKNIGEDSTWISSAGLGVRVKMTDKVDLRLDQGWQLDDDASQFHIGLQITY
jgi:hemolysin activation/secretion protein